MEYRAEPIKKKIKKCNSYIMLDTEKNNPFYCLQRS